MPCNHSGGLVPPSETSLRGGCAQERATSREARRATDRSAVSLGGLSRRSWLAIAGAAMYAYDATTVHAQVKPTDAGGHGPATASAPDEALARLADGNRQFRNEPQRCLARLAARRHEVMAHQAPWAVVVGCADSRVPPELVFGGLGLGEIFVARNAGNLVDTATLGTIEYGAAVLGAPLIVVLGHSGCGAIAAACEVVRNGKAFPGSIGPMIEPILPAALAVQAEAGDFVDNVVMASAARTAERLPARSRLLEERVAEGRLRIVAARYDLASGEVRFTGG